MKVTLWMLLVHSMLTSSRFLEVHNSLSIYSPALLEWVVSYVHKLAIAFRNVFLYIWNRYIWMESSHELCIRVPMVWFLYFYILVYVWLNWSSHRNLNRNETMIVNLSNKKSQYGLTHIGCTRKTEKIWYRFFLS